MSIPKDVGLEGSCRRGVHHGSACAAQQLEDLEGCRAAAPLFACIRPSGPYAVANCSACLEKLNVCKPPWRLPSLINHTRKLGERRQSVFPNSHHLETQQNEPRLNKRPAQLQLLTGHTGCAHVRFILLAHDNPERKGARRGCREDDGDNPSFGHGEEAFPDRSF
eukprot:6214723-Pleurochrysis_carterae.AAC.3